MGIFFVLCSSSGRVSTFALALGDSLSTLNASGGGAAGGGGAGGEGRTMGAGGGGGGKPGRCGSSVVAVGWLSGVGRVDASGRRTAAEFDCGGTSAVVSE
jgi:hypothetical protein